MVFICPKEKERLLQEEIMSERYKRVIDSLRHIFDEHRRAAAFIFIGGWVFGLIMGSAIA